MLHSQCVELNQSTSPVFCHGINSTHVIRELHGFVSFPYINHLPNATHTRFVKPLRSGMITRQLLIANHALFGNHVPLDLILVSKFTHGRKHR